MPAAAIAIPAAISAGASIFGAAKGSKAATQASEIQSGAAKQAGADIRQAVTDVNPQIINNAANASDMALRSAGGVLDAGKQGAADVNTAATNANALLNPYAQSGAAANGTLQAGLGANGDFNKTPTLADLQMDPSFNFIRKEQNQQMLRQQQARGGGMSGAAFKDLANYNEGALSQQYQQAFNNFQTSTQNRFSNLNTAAGRGMQAAGQQGGNLMDASKTGAGMILDANKSNLGANEFAGGLTYDAAKSTAANTLHGTELASDYLTQGANAQASGKIGSANAWAQGLQGVGQAAVGAGNAYIANKNYGKTANLLQNPASRAPMGPPEVTPTTTGYKKVF